MKKILLFLILCCSFSLYAQQETYYYFDEQVSLPSNGHYISVSFSDSDNRLNNRACLSKYSDRVDVESYEQADNVDGFFRISLTREMSYDEINLLTHQLMGEKEVRYAQPFYNGEFGLIHSPTHRVAVQLKPGIMIEELVAYLEDQEISNIRQNTLDLTIYYIELNKHTAMNPFAFSRFVHDSYLVNFSEPVLTGYGVLLTNDPNWGDQWGLENTGQYSGVSDADIDAPDAWTITSGRQEVVVAVIDEGVQLDHPDLQDNLVAGFDASGGGTNGGPNAVNSHGTNCAGIIGAIRDNNIGISGVAPNCRIMPVRSIVNDNATDTWLADGINWAWQNGAYVLSNSWRWTNSAQVTTAINNATANGRLGLGSVVLFASGNFNSSITYPATLSNVVAVGAMSMCNERKRSSSNSSEVNPGVSTDPANTSCDGEDWWGSCFGIEQDVMAPGVKIATTTIGSAYITNFNGTSSACPHAAGVAALVLSVNRCLTFTDVMEILAISSEKVGGYCYTHNNVNTLSTWNNQMGYGRVNAYNAVRIAFSTQISNGANISGSDQGGVGFYSWVLASGGCSGLAAATYFVTRHEVAANITFPATSFANVIGTSNGFSAASPGDGNYWFGATNITSTSAKIYTYVYETFNVLGQSLGWVPTTPGNIRFNYTVYSNVTPNQYFQNQNVSTTQVYHVMNDIYAGGQVTTAVGYGPYTILSGGNVTFRAGHEINLMNDFNVNSGGEFWGYIQPFFTCTQYPNGIVFNPGADGRNPIIHERTSPIVMTDDQMPEADAFTVFPNPFSESFTLSYTAVEERNNVEITLYDISGNQVYKFNNQQVIPPGQYQLEVPDLGHLARGVYLVHIRSEGINQTQRIIKSD